MDNAVNFAPVLDAFEREPLDLLDADQSRLEDTCLLAAQRGWRSCWAGTVWPAAAESSVREYVRDELTPDVLEAHGDGGPRWALFASFATGWLFALQGQGRLDEQASFAAFATLPGFMWLNEARITGSTSSLE